MEYVEGLLPSVGVFLVFFFLYRVVIRADKGERDAYRKAVEEYRKSRKSSGNSDPAESNENPEKSK